MTDTQYKSRSLLPHPAPAPAAPLSWPAVMARAPWAAACNAQDSLLGYGYRLIAGDPGLAGAQSFAVANAKPAPGEPSQAYADPDTWRVVSRSRVQITPGCHAAARLLYVPSGWTQSKPLSTWEPDSVGGAVRVTIDLDNGTDSDSVSHTFNLAGEFEGLEHPGPNAPWAALRQQWAPLIAPAAADEPQESHKWSRHAHALVTIERRGSPRVIDCSVFEVPLVHTSEHDEAASAAHDYSGQLPDNYPVSKTADGATYEEHRFGVARLLSVAREQSNTLSPMIFHWTSHAESAGSVLDATPAPISVANKNWEAIAPYPLGYWTDGAPGFAVPAYDATRYHESGSDLILRGKAAVIPVRLYVEARTTTAGTAAGIKVQSTPRSLVRLEFTGSTDFDWYTTTGHLECARDPSDTYPIAAPFARVSSGSIEIRSMACYFDGF